VIACLNPSTIQRLTRFRQQRERIKTNAPAEWVDTETGELFDLTRPFPQPWPGFRNEVLARLSDNPTEAIKQQVDKNRLPAYAINPPKIKPILVSRKPDRKMTGPIHKETIMAWRKDSEGKKWAVVRKSLISLKEPDLIKLYDQKSNKTFYDAIHRRMQEFGNDGKKAFGDPNNPLRMPTKDGTPGPVVRSVKLRSAQPLGIAVRNGVSDNGRMIRVDVFRKNSKFYLVPVYTEHAYKGITPNEAISGSKDGWTPIDDTFLFQFSLYPYDIVKVGKNATELVGYYRGTNRNNGAITISLYNKNNQFIESIGVKLADTFEKYAIGLLGDISRPIVGEKRQPIVQINTYALANSVHNQSGPSPHQGQSTGGGAG